MGLTGSILIVDDDRMMLNFLDITLSKLGFEILKASDGEEALDLVKLYSPDLILLDNILPKFTGFDVTNKIRKDKEFRKQKDTPIIMFSALNDPSDKVRGFELGVDDYVTKPFNFSEVLARIRTVFRHKQLSMRLLNKQRKIAVLDSLNTNLISFTRHIKKPLSELYADANKLDFDNPKEVKKIMDKFNEDYNEMLAMWDGLEEEIMEIEKMSVEETPDLSVLAKLEKKIVKHLKTIKVDK